MRIPFGFVFCTHPNGMGNDGWILMNDLEMRIEKLEEKLDRVVEALCQLTDGLANNVMTPFGISMTIPTRECICQFVDGEEPS